MFRIAFWNINTGVNSKADRILTLQAWCAAMQPDLLFLEEVSSTIESVLPGWTGMSKIDHVNTLDKNLDGSTKQIWALQKPNLPNPFKGKVGRIQNYKSKRAQIKVTNAAVDGFAAWVLHADASVKGGKAAVLAVDNYLEANRGAFVGGDFNRPIPNAGLKAKWPISWMNNPLRLTQWNKIGGRTDAPNQRLHLVTVPPYGWPVLNAQVVPHSVIDYVMLGNRRGATALPCCLDEAMWKAMLNEFDHCPVVYNLT